VNSDIDTGTVAEVFDVAGRGDVLGLGYTQMLPSIGQYRHQLVAQLNDKYFENDIVFAGEEIGPDVRSRPLSLSYQANWKSEKVSLGMSLSYIKNINGGRFNDAVSYQATRDGARQDWDSVSTDLSAQYKLGEWQLTGSAHFFDSSDRLITGEQFALGGASSVRGMEERELTGDKGYRLGLQLWSPPVKYGIRPVMFVDAGKVRINQPQIDELNDESVASVGASMYWNPNPKINMSVSFAHLFDGIDPALASSDQVSEDGNNRLHFNLAYRF
jgi:hemolysin activation/secretion protein